MKIFQAPNSGFCFGVKRAVEIAHKTAKHSKTPVYTYGPLIHNPQVVEQLQAEGVKAIKELGSLPPGTLIISSHGAPLKIIEKAKKLGFKIIDATCPFVRNAQEYAKTLCNQGYTVVVVGENHHPEVQGIVGHTQHRAQVISHLEPVDKLPKTKKLGVIAQTTLSTQKFMEVVTKLFPKTEELRVYNTICKAVIQRQQHALEFANKVDLMLIIGGKNSANTTRLTELSKTQGCKTHHIETEKEIKPKWFKNKLTVGIVAGASTPDWIVNRVKKKIKTLEEVER